MTQKSFDLAIIGAGVVGAAIFHRFAKAGLSVVLLERSADILAGASKGNSAMLHTSYDAEPGTIEQACVAAGWQEFMAVHEKLGLPLLKTGGLLVAWGEEEEKKLPAIIERAKQNGVDDVKALDARDVRRLEPNLGLSARTGVLIPGEHIIDPWTTPLAYILQGLAKGGEVWRRAQVLGGERKGGTWHLETTRGVVEAGLVINAAGLYGDLIEAIARPSPFQIKPRKGQFLVFDKPAHALITHSILPVPTEKTKGVMACRTIFGNLLVGPTAEDQESREDSSTSQVELEKLLAAGIQRLPKLKDIGVNAAYAGLRPATQFKDYQIEALPDRGWISVAGIRSTGLTGSLGIAQLVAKLCAEKFGALAESEDLPLKLPQLAEHLPRRCQGENFGAIVCHCELVTRAEIEEALCGPLPAGDLGGVKRRTRAMMGRCQGFYCSAEVIALTKGRLA